jgi:hypothetical protein
MYRKVYIVLSVIGYYKEMKNMENLRIENPIEVKNKEGWTTIELNETDLKRLNNNKPLLFNTGGNYKYMIIRVL